MTGMKAQMISSQLRTLMVRLGHERQEYAAARKYLLRTSPAPALMQRLKDNDNDMIIKDLKEQPIDILWSVLPVLTT
jgi:hypothetical protein